MQSLVAFDLATSCGWAGYDTNGALSSGVWDLSHDGGTESPGMRLVRFEQHIIKLFDESEPDLVFYELVRQQHKSSAASHWYGAFWGKLIELCARYDVNHTGLEVGAIKKFATGKGNAGKDQMVDAARKRFGNLPTAGKIDDIADALWILEYGRSLYA